MPTKIDEVRLKALIAEEIANAEGYASEELTPDREKAIQYYNGKLPDVEDVDGRSKYISRDVSNVVGWMLPDLMRVFTASDRTVDCLPETPEDEASADQAADYINFCFWRDNPGYAIMRSASWDALVNKDGIIKQFWDIREECKYSTYTGLTEDQIAVILSDDNSREVDENSSYYCRLEVVEKSKPYTESLSTYYGDDAPEETAPMMAAPEPRGLVDLPPTDHFPSMMGEQMPMEGMPPEMPTDMPMQMAAPEMEMPEPEAEMLYDVKIKRTSRKGRLVYQSVAPENFLTDPNAIDLCENWRFQAEKCVDVTRSDLIKMGFARDRVDAIPAFSVNSYTTEDLARRNLVSGQYDTPQTAMERVDLYEVYVKMDINDDGMAEIVKVMYAGNSGGAEILDWEEWDDETPYDKIPCNPIPHRMASDSIADEVIDIQKFKTVVGRQLFDNIYQTNTPQPVVMDGMIRNMDAVVNRQIGVPIITKDINAIRWDVTPFIGDKALMALEYLDNIIEMRTGVSRSSLSLDPDTLQNQTATAVQAARDSSRSQVELLARDMAEMGWKLVFSKSLRIMVKNQDRPRTIKLRDKWVDMDPRQWNVGMDVIINVGLGTGSRDRDMMMLNNILSTQTADLQQLTAAGFSEKAIDMIPKIIKTQIKIAEAAGIKSPETYYPEISPEEIEQMKQQAAQAASRGSPEMQAAQAKLDAQKAEAEANLRLDQQKAAAEIEMEKIKIASQERVKMAEIEAESRLKHMQMQEEIRLKVMQVNAELQLKRDLAMIGSTSPSMGSGSVHLGGNPG